MDDRLMSYLYFFNQKQDYYECHEYGESLWLDTGRPIILKGLIQAAVCLYHLHNGNVRGGYAMWLRARRYLAPSLPVYEHIDLSQLCKDIDQVFARVPTAFHDLIVAPETITDLHLPDVYIQLTDPLLQTALQLHTPAPLEDGK